MARLASVVLVWGVLASGVGCVWPFQKQQPVAAPGTMAPTTEAVPPLLIGPDAGGHTSQTELPPKQAAVACLAAAQELDRNGKVAEAILLYEKARQQDPSVAAGVGRRLAVLHDLTGNFDKATAEYEPLLQAAPKDSQLLNDVGYSYYARGNFAQAEQYLTQATKLDPKNKRAWLNLGLAVAAQGRLDDGLTTFSRVCSEAEARSNLAFVLAAQGKARDAADQYRRALELDPRLNHARVALERLENPPAKPPADRRTDRPVVRADRKERIASAEDVPTIHELKERIEREDAERLRSPSGEPSAAPKTPE